jgi:hypothetical protein
MVLAEQALVGINILKIIMCQQEHLLQQSVLVVLAALVVILVFQEALQVF